jgi:hypothetical protein
VERVRFVAKGQQGTHAAQQMDRYLINLVGAGEQREWDSNAERLRPPASNPRARAPSGKQLAILDFVHDRVIVVPRRPFALGAPRGGLASETQNAQELSRLDVS